MQDRLLDYYTRELHFLREMGAEFAREFPKVAERLGLSGNECRDPYVERLLEGFAFLAARVHLKIDAEFPAFTQHLFELIYPQYLAPTPAMLMARFEPDPTEGSLVEGFPIPRGTRLRTICGKGELTPCEFQTAHEVTLWPLEVAEAQYLRRERMAQDLGHLPAGARSALRLRLRTTTGLPVSALALDELTLYLSGDGRTPWELHELLNAHGLRTILRAVPDGGPEPAWIAAPRPEATGFDSREALLPVCQRSFEGYRLLQEYFGFPRRYLFTKLTGLQAFLAGCERDCFEVMVLLGVERQSMQDAVGSDNFQLFCTPAVNLMEKRADRIHMSTRQRDFHVVADRTRPLDFEVHSITRVEGIGSRRESSRLFRPFYAMDRITAPQEGQAYYSVHREPRVLTARERDSGGRSPYAGSEVYLSLADADAAPYAGELKQLAVDTLCTNRDLPLHLSLGSGRTDFTLEIGAPVLSTRCLAGPTAPKPPPEAGDTTWRLLSQLSLNYLSLNDTEGGSGAGALREMLSLYADLGDRAGRKQIEAILAVAVRPTMRRIPDRMSICHARGLEVTVSCDESGFEGGSAFLLGAVLEQFFARYVSVNSFTETVLTSRDRGEIARWDARIGTRPIL